MPGIILTFPIKTGQVEAWRRFCQELRGPRRLDYEASRRRLGVTCERLALIETAFGSAGVTTLEALDVQGALCQIIISDLPFDRWYRAQVEALYGIDLAGCEPCSDGARPQQTQELLFDWASSSVP